MAFKPVEWFTDNVLNAKNKERAVERKVRSDNYEYGGVQGGAEEAAYDLEQRGAAAQNRQATQAGIAQINYANANRDRAQGQQARQGQSALAQQMQARAMGQVPSIAQQQADRQMGQIAAQQASMAGSARGAGGLPAAQRNAAFGAANAGADISGQAQISAGNERLAAEQGASNAYANLRGGDLASQNQNAQQSLAATQNVVNQNQFNAGLRDAQSARNDARQLSYDQLANNVRTTQLAARGNYEAQQSANTMGAQSINAGVGGQNANMNRSTFDSIAGAAGNGAGAIAGALAKGGPASAAKPYLVGEEGPELVIPAKDGYVLTNKETRQALAGSPAEFINSLYNRGEKATRNVSMAQLMGMRAEGGPIQGERDSVGAGRSLPTGPTSLPNFLPPVSTWGGSPVDEEAFRRDAEEAQRARMAPYESLSQALNEQRGRQNETAARVNSAVEGIDARDRDAVWDADYKERHGQRLSREEDERATEARYRQAEDDKAKRAAAKKSRQRFLAEVMSDSGREAQQAALRIDTAYHGGGGYVPPQLIPLAGARAGGGPIFGGGLVPMGPHQGNGVGGGIELGPGGGITSQDLMRAGTGLAEPQAIRGMVGGGGITGGSSQGGRAIGAVPGLAGAREDGGPIEGEKEKPKYNYDASRPFGERFVPAHASAPAAPADPSAQPAPTRIYDPSKPFGERFVPAPVRQPVSFERTDPAKERAARKSEQAAVINLQDALQAAATYPTLAAAGPAASGGIANLITSLFERQQAKKRVDDEEEPPRPQRTLASVMGYR